MRSFSLLRHLFSPYYCVRCLKPLTVFGDCPDCDAELSKNRITDDEQQDLYMSHKHEYLETICSCYSYHPLSDTVLACKKGANTGGTEAMAIAMAKEVKNRDDFDLVIPVPGYGSDVGVKPLAKFLARKLKLKYDGTTLKKIVKTEKQHYLPAERRAANVKGAFAVFNPERIQGKRLLLCDDVLTSGNTLGECAKVLVESGAASVCAVTFAVVMPNRRE